MIRGVGSHLYNSHPETGAFIWKPRGEKSFDTRFAGKPALMYPNEKGYLTGRIDKRLVRAHRVAACYMLGHWPEQVDHINGQRADNRWSNLRPVGPYEQARNKKLRRDNTSGHVGLIFRSNRWMVFISNRYLGCFKTKEEAFNARRDAEAAEGFHENHGRR